MRVPVCPTTIGLSFLLLCGIGCSDPPSTSTTTTKENNESSAIPNEVALVIQIESGTGPEAETERVDSMNDPTAEAIEKMVREQNWSDPQHVVYMGIGRLSVGPIRRVSVQGLLGPAADSDPAHQARAQWIGNEGDKELLRESPPLDSVDTIVHLLVAAQQNDVEKLATLVKWEVTAEE